MKKLGHTKTNKTNAGHRISRSHHQQVQQGTNCWEKYDRNPASWSKPESVLARSSRKNNGKRLSECGWQRRSCPSPLMWLLAVLWDARSLLIYTTVVIQNPNKPQTSHYARSTLSAYRGSETEEKMSTANANFSVAKPQTLFCRSPGTVCCVL